MTALVVSVMLASLLGSLHCAGMCGAFLVLCVGAGERAGQPRAPVQCAYHGGRLLSYTALGAVAGGLGAALDFSGGVVGIQRAALMLAGAAVLIGGIVALLRILGVRVGRVRVPGALARWSRAGHTMAMRLPPTRMALVIGLLSTLLPCGWLYAFALVAAGTGSAWFGALTMAVFWTGTLPVMAAVGVGAQYLTGPLRRHLPAATAVMLIVIGLFTIAGRFNVPALAAAPASTDLVQQVHEIDAGELPCCHGPS